jgi:hypothetical protein
MTGYIIITLLITIALAYFQVSIDSFGKYFLLPLFIIVWGASGEFGPAFMTSLFLLCIYAPLHSIFEANKSTEEFKNNCDRRQQEINHDDQSLEKEKERKRIEKERAERDRIEYEQAKKKVEINAMNFVMRYERNNNRNPIDVSDQNIGYDISSSDSNYTRFIEVKGRGDTGDIELTQNEFNKAKECGNNYFLYVVFNVNSDYPNLYVVQNPAMKLKFSLDSYYSKYTASKYEITNYRS